MTLNLEIINAIKEGNNKKVLNFFYKEVLPKLKAYVLKNSGSKDDVNEIMQQIVEVIYRKVKLQNFFPTSELSNYAFVIGKNLWINRAKHLQRVIHTNDEIHLDNEYTININFDAQKEKNSIAYQIVEKLGDPCATFLKLRIFNEMKLEEIVKVMGYSNNDVAKSIGSRCKKKLLELLNNNKRMKDLLINEL